MTIVAVGPSESKKLIAIKRGKTREIAIDRGRLSSKKSIRVNFNKINPVRIGSRTSIRMAKIVVEMILNTTAIMIAKSMTRWPARSIKRKHVMDMKFNLDKILSIYVDRISS